MIGTIRQDQLRTQTLRAPAERVDREKRIIYGAKLMQLGDTNDDRPVCVDEMTLSQLLSMGAFPAKGMKSRFTHPNMSDDGMGKFLGRWQNFRRVGDAVLADLHLSDTAFDTPSGDLGTYVMDLAEEDPDAFGVSLAPTWDLEAMENLRESLGLEQGDRVPLRFRKIHAADVVDEPAATRGGLFSIHEPSGLPAHVTWILDHHFKGSEPQEVFDRFKAFLAKYYGGSFMSESKTAAEGQDQDQDLSAGKAYIEAFGDIGARWFIEGKSIEECLKLQVAELNGKNQALQAEVEDLKTRLSVSDQASGEDGALSADPAKTADEKRKAQALAAQKRGVSHGAAKWAVGMYPDKAE